MPQRRGLWGAHPKLCASQSSSSFQHWGNGEGTSVSGGLWSSPFRTFHLMIPRLIPPPKGFKATGLCQEAMAQETRSWHGASQPHPAWSERDLVKDLTTQVLARGGRTPIPAPAFGLQPCSTLQWSPLAYYSPFSLSLLFHPCLRDG